MSSPTVKYAPEYPYRGKGNYTVSSQTVPELIEIISLAKIYLSKASVDLVGPIVRQHRRVDL